ncbi:hypothetical protein ABR738_05630 [Streptomyces sp. Edi4]|uniref:AMP-binding enzyme n=1 Tax=Streptomyces sp. Edi4 TaxID=3162527 RepID=UPI0033067382
MAAHGDFGHLDGEGHLHFHGRGDDLFKRHGVRTSAAEIESVARDVPGVEQAVLVPPTDRRDMVLCVVTTMSPAEVLRHLGERLDPARVPGHCRVFDRFPLSSNGKTDRARLSRQVAGRQVHQGSRHEPPADGQVAIEGPSRSWSRRSSGRGVCVTSRPVLARGGVLSS